MVTDRPKLARCPGAPTLPCTNSAPPTRGKDRTPADVLAARLTTVAHPLDATALTIHALVDRVRQHHHGGPQERGRPGANEAPGPLTPVMFFAVLQEGRWPPGPA
ncbi:hypothetical protein [Streptomyces sp. NBC_01221]|uniref:hypothetical protein n=1 Tax=Streptomyces sp. NBC_01221 TaxID=2903782 RepID=UPI00224E9759|nr:hypothetical protein [Streptomyces sp. NBC_01221]